MKGGEIMKLIKQLAKSIREFKKPAIWTVLLIVGEAVIETCIPFVTSILIGFITPKADVPVVMSEEILHKMLMYGLVLIGLAFCSLACGWLAGRTAAKASAGFARNLRRDMFNKIEHFSFSNIDKFSSASLVTRLTTDVFYVQFSFMMIIRTAIRSPLMLIFSSVMAFYMGGYLGFIFIGAIIILGGGLFLVANRAMPAFHRVFLKYDKLNESIEEDVQAMRVVKGFAREEHEKKKFYTAADNIRLDFTKAERIVALNSPLMSLCMYSNMVLILLLGSYIITNNGGIGFGINNLQAMLAYGVQILMSLMMLSMIYVMLTISAESAHRICEVLNEEPSIANPENGLKEVKDGSIDFNNVSFKYKLEAENYALKDVNLHIKSGATVGILGGTGSSKSTLVQLIPRLYDVTEGSVQVAGVDVRNYNITALRDAVSMVLQKNLLFSGTIIDNLRWGNKDATLEEIEHACKLAQADEFIKLMPDGYNTKIEQGGTNVSGGQKQRLCIARALLKKPKILILDDSTSAVDMKTDALIRAGFKQYIPETTKIIIAQRVASVMDADLIVVLDGGRIKNMGTHEELLASEPIYKEIYEQQTKGGDDHE